MMLLLCLMTKMHISNKSVYVEKIVASDHHLKSFFDSVGDITIPFSDNGYTFLLFSIIGQQVSAKVAETIYKRLEEKMIILTPENMLRMDLESLRSLGISYRKAQTILDFSNYVFNAKFQESDYFNASKIEPFIHIKGIGPWTIDMYKMFVLKDLNYFSFRDLGLISALKSIYPIPLDTLDDMMNIAKKWEPYKGIVAHYLWAYWDTRSKK